jgi:hypothetical protein
LPVEFEPCRFNSAQFSVSREHILVKRTHLLYKVFADPLHNKCHYPLNEITKTKNH